MKRSEETTQESPDINGAARGIERGIKRRYSNDGNKTDYKSTKSSNPRQVVSNQGMTFESPQKEKR